MNPVSSLLVDEAHHAISSQFTLDATNCVHGTWAEAGLSQMHQRRRLDGGWLLGNQGTYIEITSDEPTKVHTAWDTTRDGGTIVGGQLIIGFHAGVRYRQEPPRRAPACCACAPADASRPRRALCRHTSPATVRGVRQRCSRRKTT